MPTRDQSYRFCSAPCGSGKTHKNICRACELIESGSPVAIAMPTKELIEKTVREELTTRQGYPDYHIFHSDRVSAGTSVSKELTAYLKCKPAPLLFITHQVLHCISYWHDQRNWHLALDEGLPVIRRFQHRVPDTHTLITDHLTLHSVNAFYSEISVTDRGELDRKSKNRGQDEILAQIAGTLRTICNRHHRTFVDSEQYKRLKQGQVRTLTFHSLLQPSVLRGFRSVFMAAANFTDMAVYRLWRDQGVRFVEDEEFAKSLRYSSHSNGYLITIYYFIEHPWSRRRADTRIGNANDTTTLDYMINAVGAEFRDERFLWQANKRVVNVPFGRNAFRLPNKPHGLNSYNDVHNIAFLSSLLPPPDQFKFLSTMGLSSEDVRTITYYNNVYQSIMRTSIRNPEDNNPKRVIVPDLPTAEYLQKLFPGSRIERLEIGLPKDHCAPQQPGRPRVHRSNRERVAALRERRKAKRIEMLADLLILKNSQNQMREQSCCNENTIKIYRDFVTGYSYTGTLYANKRSDLPLGYLSWAGDEAFIDFLVNLHNRQLKSKEDNFLLSPAVFDPSLSDHTKRGYDNIISLRNIWLLTSSGRAGSCWRAGIVLMLSAWMLKQ